MSVLGLQRASGCAASRDWRRLPARLPRCHAACWPPQQQQQWRAQLAPSASPGAVQRALRRHRRQTSLPCRPGSGRVRRAGRTSAIPPTASLSQHLLGLAAKAGARLPDIGAGLSAAIDPGVLAATLNASAKLFLICSAVGWLLRTGRIPNSTATVLSKVSYELLIPCMLFSKVASTLAVQPDTTLLLGISAAAILQICIGAACGLGLTALAGLTGNSAAQQQGREGEGGGRWQGRTSPEAASAIALSMAAASGAPQAAAALRPRQPTPAAGPAQLVPAAAAFGNSFTLPAVFLTTLLPKPLADRALGYAALFLLAWSPCLWSIGLALVGGNSKQAQQAGGGSRGSGVRGLWFGGAGPGAGQAQQAQQEAQPALSEGSQPKPLPWKQPPVVDVTPVPPPASSGSGSDAAGQGGGSGSAAQVAGILEPPSWAERLANHPLTSRLLQFANQVLNPPVLAILAGTVVGLTPAGRALIAASKSTGAAAAGAVAAAAALPPELGMVHAFARAALEVIELLAEGTLASQTLVLAASLLQRPEGQPAAVGPASLATAAAASSRHRRGVLGAFRGLLPSDDGEARALAVLSLTRFLLLPLATIGALQALAAGGLLPPVLSDPVLLFVLLTEAVMPSAQNLIIVLQLSERTQSLAPGFARMLLKLYAYAVLPVTLWVTAFATNLSIPVLR